jgi:hypothetical protein
MHLWIDTQRLNQVKAGDRVIVASAFGSGPAEDGLVKEVFKEIKNGRPGFSYYTVKNGMPTQLEKWAYKHQLIKVVK